MAHNSIIHFENDFMAELLSIVVYNFYQRYQHGQVVIIFPDKHYARFFSQGSFLGEFDKSQIELLIGVKSLDQRRRAWLQKRVIITSSAELRSDLVLGFPNKGRIVLAAQWGFGQGPIPDLLGLPDELGFNRTIIFCDAVTSWERPLKPCFVSLDKSFSEILNSSYVFREPLKLCVLDETLEQQDRRTNIALEGTFEEKRRALTKFVFPHQSFLPWYSINQAYDQLYQEQPDW